LFYSHKVYFKYLQAKIISGKQNLNWAKNVDLVMWTKNSAKFLPTVLKQIEKVIPSEVIKNKIIIDDHSADNTVSVAQSLGWTVHYNSGKGIGQAYQTALHYITADFLVSVEHDVVLTPDWWSKISPYMENSKVVVAQGVRAGTNPIIHKLDEYTIERQDEASKLLNISLDNNLYRMSIIRKYNIDVISGLPASQQLDKLGFKWLIDTKTVSGHIRSSVWWLIQHDYKAQKDHISRNPNLDMRACFFVNLFRFIYSPIRALDMSVKKNCPQLMVIYPIDRLWIMKAYAEPKPKWRKHQVLAKKGR
jgi:glycosyltransferase involved in cell wall biosynthesis